MIKTKTIVMVLLVAITTIGAIGIGIGTATHSAQAQFCRDECGPGQSESHDINGDINSGLHTTHSHA